MSKPTKIPLISDPSKHYYLPWEVDEYINRVEEELGQFYKLVADLEVKDIILWDGEGWVISRSCEK